MLGLTASWSRAWGAWLEEQRDRAQCSGSTEVLGIFSSFSRVVILRIFFMVGLASCKKFWRPRLRRELHFAWDNDNRWKRYLARRSRYVF